MKLSSSNSKRLLAIFFLYLENLKTHMNHFLNFDEAQWHEKKGFLVALFDIRV